MANSNHPNHTVLTRKLQQYLRWRNANARHPNVLAAQRRERAQRCARRLRVLDQRVDRLGGQRLRESLSRGPVNLTGFCVLCHVVSHLTGY